MNKLIVVALVGLLLVSCVYFIYSYQNNISKEDKPTVYNPSTGETWGSVEEYVYRNITEELNGKG